MSTPPFKRAAAIADGGLLGFNAAMAGLHPPLPRRFACAWAGLLLCLLAMLFVAPASARPATAASPPAAASVAPEAQSKGKDFWDKLDAASGVISGLLVAGIGFWATNLYNRRQKEAEERRKDQEILVSQIQTVEKFIPHLAGTDEQIKRAALVSISALGNSELAVELSKLFAGPGATSALTEIASNSRQPGALSAQKSLLSVFAPLQSRVVSLLVNGKRTATAFVVSDQGWVATTAHALAGAGPGGTYEVAWPGGERLAATLLEKDEARDLALLAVQTALPLSPVEIEPTPPDLGEAVTALQIRMDDRVILVFGHVREIRPAGSAPATIGVDVSTFPGSSGSPVMNREGRLLGVVHSSEPQMSYLVSATDLFDFVEATALRLSATVE